MVDGQDFLVNVAVVSQHEMVVVDEVDDEYEQQVESIVQIHDIDELDIHDNEMIEQRQLLEAPEVDEVDGANPDVQARVLIIEVDDDADIIVTLVENDIGMHHEVDDDNSQPATMVYVVDEDDELVVITVDPLQHTEVDDDELVVVVYIEDVEGLDVNEYL